MNVIKIEPWHLFSDRNNQIPARMSIKPTEVCSVSTETRSRWLALVSQWTCGSHHSLPLGASDSCSGIIVMIFRWGFALHHPVTSIYSFKNLTMWLVFPGRECRASWPWPSRDFIFTVWGLCSISCHTLFEMKSAPLTEIVSHHKALL